ncbi:nucleolar complex protein 2 isoform X2 [Linepithema humile]|uniref:nucleolar complex protein 2 isoform X2 n=1 Tax=Linepithema humile TaxID=83485 RepID=UPI00351EEBF7
MKVKKVSQKSTTLSKEKRLGVKRKKKDLSKVTTEEFFEQDFHSDIDSDENNDTDNDNYDENYENNKNNDDLNSDQEDSDESDLNPVEHKKSLIKLKDTDPEFFKYLEENDKNLLDFNLSDDEDDGSSIKDFDDRHIPQEELEVASDDSDFHPEETEENSKKKITLKLLKIWQQEIQTDKSTATIKHAVEAFRAALNSVAVSSDTATRYKATRYKVEGSAVFNGVVQLCITHLSDAFKRFLKLDPESHEAHKSKRFGKIRGTLKLYLTDLFKLLENVTSSNIQTVLLKHLRYMLPYMQSFSSLTKPLLRILLKLWCETGDETVRVISFLNIFYIAINHRESILEKLLKTMYVKYVRNTEFVSSNTLPSINFMRLSLVEIYALDHDLSYNHAFLFIRQLAIHLRNAVTLKKKENFRIVYHWQYINSLRFWVDFITKSKDKSMLRSLLYPLIQIIIGTIKLIPTVQHYPLRFHCIEMLLSISKETGVFIPILPFLLELKAFLKKCHIATYCKKMKQLLSMIEENRKYIETERTKVTIDLRNMGEITNWENRVKTDGTEIAKFYATWAKLHESQKLKMLTKNEEEINASVLRQSKKQKFNEQSAEDSEEESELEFRVKGLETKIETKESTNTTKKLVKKTVNTTKRNKNKKIKVAKNAENDLPRENTDIVLDINSDDWD